MARIGRQLRFFTVLFWRICPWDWNWLRWLRHRGRRWFGVGRIQVLVVLLRHCHDTSCFGQSFLNKQKAFSKNECNISKRVNACHRPIALQVIDQQPPTAPKTRLPRVYLRAIKQESNHSIQFIRKHRARLSFFGMRPPSKGQGIIGT